MIKDKKFIKKRNYTQNGQKTKGGIRIEEENNRYFVVFCDNHKFFRMRKYE